MKYEIIINGKLMEVTREWMLEHGITEAELDQIDWENKADGPDEGDGINLQ